MEKVDNVKKVGRPPTLLNRNQIIALARLHCTMQEMADFFECHVDTLRDNFSKEIHKGRSEGNISLRRKQWEVAVENGNTVMLIWLGKQMLGQVNERVDSESDVPLPIYDIIDSNPENIKIKEEQNDK